MERKYNAVCPFCKHNFQVKYLEVNLICEECNSIIGYHKDSSDTMPKPGSFFLVPKGTRYHSMHKGHLISKKRSEKRLHHILNGIVNWHNGMVFRNGQYIVEPCLLIEENPSVRWAGSGGYWCTVDINRVELL